MKFDRRRMLGLENEFVICNPTPDPYRVPWGGETVVVPPRHVAVAPHPKFDDVRHSYQLDDGTYMPGTLVIRDVKTIGDLGEDVIHWSSAACIAAKIGINFAGEFGMRGLFWLPPGFEQSDYDAIADEQFVRWQEAKQDDARRVVYEYEAQMAVHRERNLVPPPPPPQYDEAKAFLGAVAEKMQKSYAEIVQPRGRVMGDAVAEAQSFRVAAEAVRQQPAPSAPEASLGVEPDVVATAVAAASEPTVQAKTSLAKSMLADPEMRELLKVMIDSAVHSATSAKSQPRRKVS